MKALKNTRELEVHEKVLANKVDQVELLDFRVLIKVLPTAEQVRALENRYLSSIRDFGADNARFRQEHKQQVEMIRRYDEVISAKCNKHHLKEVEAE